MSRRRIKVDKQRQILRLRYDCGLNMRVGEGFSTHCLHGHSHCARNPIRPMAAPSTDAIVQPGFHQGTPLLKEIAARVGSLGRRLPTISARLVSQWL